MEPIRSRLTTKYQATIPGPVRKALHLSSGDALVFEISEQGTVSLRKQTPFDAEYAHALGGTLESEWASEADEAAYGGL